MGLIGKCGLLKANSEAELIRCVQMAYEAYRRDFLIRASKQRGMIYHHLGWLLRPPKYFEDEEGNPSPSIDLVWKIASRYFRTSALSAYGTRSTLTACRSTSSRLRSTNGSGR